MASAAPGADRLAHSPAFALAATVLLGSAVGLALLGHAEWAALPLAGSALGAVWRFGWLRRRRRHAVPVDGLLAASREPLLLVGAGGLILAANAAAESLLGAGLAGRPLARYLPSDSLAAAEAGPLEVEARAESTRVLPVEIMASPLPAAGTWLVRITDVSGRAQRTAELERLALHDALTGLPNRLLLRDRLAQAIRAGERSGEPLALMLLDLDGFKQVNDTLGHQVGDLVLQAVGPRLAEPLRRSDTLARLGGDEFCIVLPGPTDAAVACQIAERLVDGLARPFLVEGMPLELGVSIGVALYPEHGLDPDCLLEHADAAMYRAKRDRLGFCLHEGGAVPSDGRAQLRADLRRAIDAGELALLYLPKVDAASRAIVGLEALLRWPHPQRGLLTPDAFLPIAEQTGLILPLTLWVLGRCLREQRRWRLAGHDLPVAVNISSKWLRDERFPAILRLLMQQADGRPDRLILEMTESGLMADPERAASVMRELAELGCRLSLDDFGTGQSSLPWLQRLSLHEIKIDCGLVAAMATDRGSAVVVRSLVRLAHELGLRAVAEGVETEATARRLLALGCDELQGFLFGQPVAAALVVDTLRHTPPGPLAAAAGEAAG